MTDHRALVSLISVTVSTQSKTHAAARKRKSHQIQTNSSGNLKISVMDDPQIRNYGTFMRYLRMVSTTRSLNHAAAIRELSQHIFGISCVVINFTSQEKALNTDHRPLVWIISVKCSTQSKKKTASRKRSIVQIQTDSRGDLKISVMDATLFLNYGISYAVSSYGIYYSQFKPCRSYSGTKPAYLRHILRCYQFYLPRESTQYRPPTLSLNNFSQMFHSKQKKKKNSFEKKKYSSDTDGRQTTF